MEASSRHLKKKYNSVSHNNEILSHNNDLVSHNNDIVSQNNEKNSHNNDLVSHNNDIVSQNNDLLLKRKKKTSSTHAQCKSDGTLATSAGQNHAGTPQTLLVL